VVGEVPEGWEMKRLKHISDLRLSNVDKHTVEGHQAVHLCNYLDLYNNERINSEIDFMIATATDDQFACFRGWFDHPLRRHCRLSTWFS